MKKLKFLLIVIIVMVLLVLPGLSQRLVVRNYIVVSEKIQAGVRIAFITDLHSCRYGENMIELIEAIEAQKPDLILLGGDIFDDVLPDVNTELLLQAISPKYPCYYVTGNHEYWSGDEAFFKKMAILKEHQVTRLAGDRKTLEIKHQTIHLIGLDDPDAYMLYAEDGLLVQEQKRQVEAYPLVAEYTILLSHRPELTEFYHTLNVDLILSGHAHGGQWRIPGILNGLLAPNQGLFPKYAGGRYQLGEKEFIVSRGLARESTRIPRIYNRPELVIIDLK